jgi:hypothetical protein
VLVHYFPAQETNLSALHDAALAAIPDGAAKRNGILYGGLAAEKVLRERADDGLQTPIGSTSSFPTLAPGPGVWRLAPPTYAAPQTPWMATMRPFVLDSADQFLPPPPPSLQSQQWVDAFNEVKSLGAAPGDGERGRGRRDDRDDEREVPLPALASRDGHRSDVGGE